MRMHVPKLRAFATSATVALVVTTSVAVPARAGSSPVPVSGPSPYADCDAPLLHGERTYVNAEVEPWIAVDPSDAKHLVGAWQQDRHSVGGGASGLMSAVSTDHGRTWDRTTLPFSRCAPGGLHLERTSDPWVSFGPDGTVYAISIAWNISNGRNVVASASSADGGMTWVAPVIVHTGPDDLGLGDDKESITADPIRPGVAYATWTLLGLASVGSREVNGELWFARTTDGGATWRTRRIYDPPGGGITLAAQIVVDPTTGTLFDVFNYRRRNRGYQEVVRSDDGGATWSAPITIGRDLGIGASHPNTGDPLRVGNEVPDVALDPRNGDLYVLWEDSRFSDRRYDEVVMSRSTDAARSWSPPVRVNTPTGLPAFTPSIAINPHGVIGVSYYDVRELGSETDTLPTDVWLVKLHPGGDRRIGEWKLGGPFDMMAAPFAGGAFLGDYEGLAVSGNRFAAFFAIANDGDRHNRTDIVSVVR